jgi:hypothetical protein
VTTQTPTHPWQTRGERLGEISLVLIGFTIPLSNALCTGVFPALAVMAWLMMRGWRGVPKLLRENRAALFAWLPSSSQLWAASRWRELGGLQGWHGGGV